MELKVQTQERVVVSARINGDAYMDAARVGDIGGLEVEVDLHALRTMSSPREYRGARDMVVLDAHPATLERLALTILDKLDKPALNESEWRLVVHALRQLTNGEPSATRDDAEIRALADRLETQAASEGRVR
jgi:hypothetical protein